MLFLRHAFAISSCSYFKTSLNLFSASLPASVLITTVEYETVLACLVQWCMVQCTSSPFSSTHFTFDRVAVAFRLCDFSNHLFMLIHAWSIQSNQVKCTPSNFTFSLRPGFAVRSAARSGALECTQLKDVGDDHPFISIDDDRDVARGPRCKHAIREKPSGRLWIITILSYNQSALHVNVVLKNKPERHLNKIYIQIICRDLTRSADN